MTVSVEISDPNIKPGHQQSMREIQRLLVTQVNTRDQWTLEIDNPDGGNYQIGILNPKTKTFWWSNPMSTNLTSWPVTVAVSGYYSSVFSAGLSLNFVNYDANGAVTYNSMKVAKTVITFICTRSISMPSTS